MRHAVIVPRDRRPARQTVAAAFGLAALVAAGCGDKPGTAREGVGRASSVAPRSGSDDTRRAGGEQSLRQAVLGKRTSSGDGVAGKGQTHEVTPDKWVVNTPVGAVAYTYTLDGDRLVQRAGASSPMKSRVRVDGDAMTLALMKEENAHLYGQETGKVVTRLQRVK